MKDNFIEVLLYILLVFVVALLVFLALTTMGDMPRD